MSWAARWAGWRDRLRSSREDRRPLSVLSEDFVAVDLETTGLDSRRDAIVSLALVPFHRGSPGESYDTLVHPGRPIPAASTRIHGITDAMVEAAPAIETLVGEIETRCGAHPVVGHGIAFDMACLARAFRSEGRPPLASAALCTMRLAAALRVGWEDLSLEAIATRLDVPVVGRHTARGDAVLAGRVMLGLLPVLARRGCRTLADVLHLQNGVVLRHGR